MSAGVAQAVTSGCAAALRTCASHASLWTQRAQSGRAPRSKARRVYPQIRAVSAPEECNEEDCAPEKEVGKISMEWLAEERTKVTGTYPPLTRKWTGYVEKDTAGQTNIYSVEPTVYVSETAFSSGSAGESSEGSNLTVAVSAGLGLGLILAAGIVLLRVGSLSNSEPAYEGPNLSFYIQKFKASTVAESKVAPKLSNPTEVPFGFYEPLDEEL